MRQDSTSKAGRECGLVCVCFTGGQKDILLSVGELRGSHPGSYERLPVQNSNHRSYLHLMATFLGCVRVRFVAARASHSSTKLSDGGAKSEPAKIKLWFTVIGFFGAQKGFCTECYWKIKDFYGVYAINSIP